MNCFTECNSLNIGARSKAWASATEKQELERAPSIEGKSSKGSGPQEFFKLIETSPMVVSAPAAKAVAKRKKRQNWCKVEDDLLIKLVRGFEPHEIKWPQISIWLNATFESTRTGKQCRERWRNHLRPNIKKGNWTSNEEIMIEHYHTTFGPKWSLMAKLMKNRTDNDIKNKWNSMKRVEKAGGRRKSAPSRGTSGYVGEVAEEQRTHRVHSSRWGAIGETAAPEKQASDRTKMFTATGTFGSKCFAETLIAHTVTDGGSAESSPVPKKKYWNYAV